MPDPAAIVVSSLALLFTALSFWWMNWRPGKLVVGNLQGYIAGRSTVVPSDEPNRWVVGLPLVLLNTGASPLVIESLRLIPCVGLEADVLLFETTETPIWTHEPQKVDSQREPFYLPRAIKANDVDTANYVFHGPVCNRKYENKLYHYLLEAKLSGSREWEKVKDIELDFREFDMQKLSELNMFYKPYRYRKGERA